MSAPADVTTWFRVSEFEPGVVLVAEPGHVSCWLVRGRERSVLIDTGLGVSSIAAAVRDVEPGHVTVVTSHGNFDHVCGNHEFDERLIHEAGAESVQVPVPAALLRVYWEACAGIRAEWERLLAVDRETHAFRLGPDEEVCPGLRLGSSRPTGESSPRPDGNASGR